MLYIHGIHTTTLTSRQPAFHQVIQNVRLAAQKVGFEVVPRLVLTPNPSNIQADIKQYEGLIDYSKPVAPDEIINSIHTLNLQEISNLEKHKKAWQFAAAASPNTMHMILEDDATLVPTPENLNEVLQQLKSAKLMPLCTTIPRSLWLSKEGYILTPSIAAALLADTEKIKFNARGALSWWAHQHPESVSYPANRVTFDGSKLGLCPSAIHSHNPLIFNKDYTEMLAIAASEPKELDVKVLAKFEQSATTPQSPDYMHLLGILFYRANNYTKARDMFIRAIQELGRQGGVLSTKSELIMNALIVHKHLQPDLVDALKLPSKYTKMSVKPLVL